MNKELISEIEKYIINWGGKLILLDKDKMSLSDLRCIFSNEIVQRNHVELHYTNNFVAFDYDNKEIIYETRSRWDEIIHAAGHVFCIKDNKENYCPDNLCFSFFAWEISFLEAIGCSRYTWANCNSEYCVEMMDGSLLELKNLSNEKFDNIIKYRVEIEKKNGLFDEFGKFKYIR